MNFIESMRRRWEVLGIGIQEKGKTKGSLKGKEREVINVPLDESMQVDEEEESEEARRAIMQGALVESAIDSATKG